MTLEIEVLFANIPSELIGIPLPVDLIADNGQRQEGTCYLSQTGRVSFKVDTPDNEQAGKATSGKATPAPFVVRAQLPSGLSVVQSVEVPLQPIKEPLMVTLDFAAAGTKKARPSDEIRSRSLESFGVKAFGLENALIELESNRLNTRILAGGYLPSLSLDISNANTPAVLYLRAIPSETMARNGLSHVEFSDPRDTSPLYLVVAYGDLQQYALVAWPPNDAASTFPTLLSLPDKYGETRPSFVALDQTTEPTVKTLFSFVQKQALGTAQRLTPHLLERANDFLYGKVENPIHATLAAYCLLKVKNDEKQDWVKNLADWFEYLPDGAIIYAWYLIFDGNADGAHGYLEIALKRGLPMYSEGVRLLRDGFQYLYGLYPKDEALKERAQFASLLASIANLESELTCLSLGKGLDVRLEDIYFPRRQ